MNNIIPAGATMKTSVIIPTYRRPGQLKDCIESLLKQRRLPDEIVVVVTAGDTDTYEMLEKHQATRPAACPIKIASIVPLNIVYAENKGCEAAKGDIICFIDDDAVAPENWIEAMLRHYEGDPSVGGVGGPVISVVGDTPIIEYTDIFSRMTWFGRRITNTAKIPVKTQEVHILRGANMSFRREAMVRFDEHLLPYWRRFEDDLCLSIRERGYKLICDPALGVLHYDTKSHAGKKIDQTPETIIGLHHNSMYVKLKHCKGIGKMIAFLYEFIWGDLKNPGFFQFIGYGIKHRSWRSFSDCGYAMVGKVKGVSTYLRSYAVIARETAGAYNEVRAAKKEPARYEAKEYWQDRLTGKFSLVGTGHIGFSEKYNRYMYRLKARALGRVIARRHIDIRNAAVLDIGCGTGYFTDYYLKKGALSVTGVDIADVSVSSLRRKYPGQYFYRLDVGREPIPDNKRFDIVHIFDVLYHIVDGTSFAYAIKNIGSAAKSGAWIFFTDTLDDAEQDVTHRKCRPLKTYSEILAGSGIEIVEIMPIFHFMSRGVSHAIKSSTIRRLCARALELSAPLAYIADLVYHPYTKDSMKLVVCRKKTS
ncbi:MAG: glycosyltransferase [Candidatus Omnitrophota bacterium]